MALRQIDSRIIMIDIKTMVDYFRLSGGKLNKKGEAEVTVEGLIEYTKSIVGQALLDSESGALYANMHLRLKEAEDEIARLKAKIH